MIEICAKVLFVVGTAAFAAMALTVIIAGIVTIVDIIFGKK